MFIALHWSKTTCGYLQLLADYFPMSKEYKETQLNTLGPSYCRREAQALWQERMRAASKPDIIALSWACGQSNLLIVAQWNPCAGDVHPCPKWPSGGHIQCCHPLCCKLLRGTSPRLWNSSSSWRMRLSLCLSQAIVFPMHQTLHCCGLHTKQHSCLLNSDF